MIKRFLDKPLAHIRVRLVSTPRLLRMRTYLQNLTSLADKTENPSEFVNIHKALSLVEAELRRRRI